MKCPRTDAPLKPTKAGGIEIDISMGCGGIWLDKFELEKFTEPSAFAGELLVEHLKQFHKPLPELEKRLKCPKDIDVVMMRRFYSPKMQVEIDECPACGGIWLDAEELEQIRVLFPNSGDYEATQKAFISNVLSSKEVQELNQEQEQYICKLRSVSNVLWSMIKFGF